MAPTRQEIRNPSLTERELDTNITLRTTGEIVTVRWAIDELPDPQIWWWNLHGNEHGSKLRWLVEMGWIEPEGTVESAGVGRDRRTFPSRVSEHFAKTREVHEAHRRLDT